MPGLPALLPGLLLGLATIPPAAAAEEAARPRTRTFLFTYATTVTGLPAGKVARIWLPVAPVSAEQDVEVVAKELPGKKRVGRDPTYRNLILHVEARANAEGKIPLRLTYKVTRREVRTDGKAGISLAEADRALARFLQPDARVPITGKPLELLRDREVPADELQAGRLLYDLVNKHMTYDKSKPGWGKGDAVWACGSGFGNCSDFHSLFISLARSRKIPAKFDMGFPLPDRRGAGDVGGYHCWAWFKAKGKGWVPVDISEANKNPKLVEYYFGNLTPDRVKFSTGRDIQLVPRQDGPPLNFFIYPHVEVDGKVYPQDRVKNRFTYKDLDGAKGE
jgi:transglutaminase-like putative cysteine protease